MNLIIHSIHNPPYLLISWDGLWCEMIDRVDYFSTSQTLFFIIFTILSKQCYHQASHQQWVEISALLIGILQTFLNTTLSITDMLKELALNFLH